MKWSKEGIAYEADPKHRRLILEYFGLDEGSRSLSTNGERDCCKDEDGQKERLDAKKNDRILRIGSENEFLRIGLT